MNVGVGGNGNHRLRFLAFSITATARQSLGNDITFLNDLLVMNDHAVETAPDE